MKLQNKIIDWYFNFPTTGSFGLKVILGLMLTAFIASGFDSSIIKGVFE